MAIDQRGLTLVQDVVVNHVGNFFAFDDWREGEPAHSWRRTRGSRPSERPTQWPFSQNDPNDPAQRALSVYHWTPLVRDYTDDDREAPGMLRVAAAQGNPRLHLFGEGFGIDRPFEDAQMRKIDAYQRVEGGLPAMIQFPMYRTFGDVFARGHAPKELAWRIERTLSLHADPWRMPTFVDNHDVDRFLAGASEPALQQALLAMLTLPGIPVIYYGTEQGFRGQRDAMFATGFGSGDRDHFDTTHPLYRRIAAMVQLRRAHPVLSRARPVVLAADGAGPLLRANAQGRVIGELPARAGGVWRIEPASRTGDGAAAPEAAALPTLDAVPAVVRGDVMLTGTLPVGRDGTLVLDGEGLASEARTFRVERDWALLAEATDPADDDAGPDGRYRYPTDPSYAGRASMDLRGLRVFGSGGALALEFTMGEVLDSWNPANGFDHVAFSVFLSLPGRTDGATALSGQNATLPEGRRWCRARASPSTRRARWCALNSRRPHSASRRTSRVSSSTPRPGTGTAAGAA